MAFLKSPDPGAHALIADGRLYPVRDGIFLVPDALVGEPVFETYEHADQIPAGVAAELEEEGSHDHPDAEEPEVAVAAGPSSTGAPSVADAHILQLSEELKSAIAEKDAAVAEAKRLLEEAQKPFEIVGADVEGLSIEVEHEARKIFVRLGGEAALEEHEKGGDRAGAAKDGDAAGGEKKAAEKKPRSKKAAAS
jgi:hypothetical protein